MQPRPAGLLMVRPGGIVVPSRGFGELVSSWIEPYPLGLGAIGFGLVPGFGLELALFHCSGSGLLSICGLILCPCIGFEVWSSCGIGVAHISDLFVCLSVQ